MPALAHQAVHAAADLQRAALQAGGQPGRQDRLGRGLAPGAPGHQGEQPRGQRREPPAKQQNQ